MNGKYPTFTREILALGKTNHERAKALGVSLRTLITYKNRPETIPVGRLLARPELFFALGIDAQSAQSADNQAI